MPAHGKTAPSADVLVPGLVLVLATLGCYADSLRGPFVFDDQSSLVTNPTIRSVWPPWRALMPPHGQGLTVEGRPLLNLSFAINHAISGYRVWSYHALNLAIHAGAVLVLFGIARRTLMRTGQAGTWTAFAVALLWAVHPLQTESVTYIVQRAESLMGLFWLLTLYCFIRSVEACGAGSGKGRDGADNSAWWRVGSWAACLCGMATKEVMVSAPIMVLLYDRTFVSGTLRDAWMRSRGYYLALASTWLPLFGLTLASGNRGATVGAVAGVSRAQYGWAQLEAVTHYLRLAFWPSPLVFDYGWIEPGNAAGLFACGLLVATLAVFTAIGIARRAGWGFLGAWFFAVLAPSSSLIPVVRQTVAEHRMYLPLAAVVALAVVGGRRFFGPRVGFVAAMVAATALAATTWGRNRVYRSEMALYADSAAKMPANSFAVSNWGNALFRAGRVDEALAQFEKAVRLKGDFAEARYNLGTALAARGRTAAALEQFREAVRIDPFYARAHYNTGNCLAELGRAEAAVAEYREAVRLAPDFEEAHHNLGTSLRALGRTPEAVDEFEAAVRLNSEKPGYFNDLGVGLAEEHRYAEATQRFGEALRLRPDFPEAEINLGAALAAQGRAGEAVAHYKRAVALDPGSAEARYDLGTALFAGGSAAAGIDQLAEALRLRPAFAEAHLNLANAYMAVDKPAAAVPHYREALRLRPDLLNAGIGLRLALQRLAPPPGIDR